MYRTISLFDIAFTYPEIFKGIREENKDEFDARLNKILFYLGLDINSDEFTEKVVYHRPLTRKSKEPYLGVVFTSRERSDKEWLKSPYCSLDQKLYCSKDISMSKELSRISKKLTWDDQVKMIK